MNDCQGEVTSIHVDHVFPVNSPTKKKNNEAEDEIEETPQEKKLRLAKLYLEQLRQQGERINLICKELNICSRLTT